MEPTKDSAGEGPRRSGILGYDSFHFVVENMERSRQFYVDRLDFKEVARAGDDLVARGGQASSVFGAGQDCLRSPITKELKASIGQHSDEFVTNA